MNTELIHNHGDVETNEVNNVVKRAKLLVINDKEEILLCYSNNNYFFIGGHVDGEETDMECLEREILEESGVQLTIDNLSPFFTIKYYDRDYPKPGVNTLSLINYYELKYNLLPNLNNINLTPEESEGGFTLVYIPKNKIISLLEDSIPYAKRPGVIKDTIDALQTYLQK